MQSDEHFFVVCRYVERNALRANLVARAMEQPTLLAKVMVLEDDEEPRGRFLEVVRDAPDSEAIESEPAVAPVVSLRPGLPVVTAPIEDVDEPDDVAPATAAAVAAAIPSPDLAVAPRATQGWFAAHMSSVLLGTGLVAGVGATLALQRLGGPDLVTPAKIAELETVADACEQTLEHTRGSLAQVQQELDVPRDLALHRLASSASETRPVDEIPRATAAVSPPSTSSPPRSFGMASAARHRSIRRSLDKVLAAVKKCDEDAGGGRLSTLRARIRVEPNGEASAVELTHGASIAVCVTKAVRSRRYQAGDAAEWVRHDFVFDSKEEMP